MLKARFPFCWLWESQRETTGLGSQIRFLSCTQTGKLQKCKTYLVPESRFLAVCFSPLFLGRCKKIRPNAERTLCFAVCHRLPLWQTYKHTLALVLHACQRRNRKPADGAREPKQAWQQLSRAQRAAPTITQPSQSLVLPTCTFLFRTPRGQMGSFWLVRASY